MASDGIGAGAVDRDELRAVQGPLKERYSEDPDSATVTLRATGTLGEGITCSVADRKSTRLNSSHT